MKKILFIHHCGDLGGAGISLVRTMKMASEAFEVKACVPAGSPVEKLLRENGLESIPYDVQAGTIEYYSGGPRFPGRTYVKQALSRPVFASFVKKIINSEHPDACVFNSLTLSYLVPVAVKTGVKTGIFVRETFPHGGSKAMLAKYRRLLGEACAVFYISGFDRDFWKITSAENFVIRNSVPEEFFAPSADAGSISGKPFTVLYTGGANPIKGIEVIARAAELFPGNIRLLAAGDPEEKMAPYFKNASCPVEYLGLVENMKPVYDSADIVAIPIVTPHQARPVFEAGAAGKPVVISDFPEISEYVTDGLGGLKFKPGDSAMLAEKIVFMAENREKCRKMGENNRRLALKNHSAESVSKGLVAALTRLTGTRCLHLTNVPSPYRVDFYNELSKSEQTVVCFERTSAKGRSGSWFGRSNPLFAYKYLRGVPLGEDKAVSFGVKKLVLRPDFDKIIVSGYSSPAEMRAISVLRSHRRPYILSADGGIIKDGGRGFRFAVKKHFIKGAEKYLSPSSPADRYFIHYGAEPERIVRYPFTSLFEDDICSSPASSEEKKALRREFGLPETGRIAFACGRFIPGKGYEELISAASGVSGLTVVIAGGEPTAEYLKIMAEKDVRNVRFAGFSSKETLKKMYRACDFFVHPTKSDVWGLVINEAMAAGLPVITTDMCVAGVTLIGNSLEELTRKIAKNDGKTRFAAENNCTGAIIKPSDTGMLKEALIFFRDLPDEIVASMGENSLRVIRDYTFEKMAAAHASIDNISKK